MVVVQSYCNLNGFPGLSSTLQRKKKIVCASLVKAFKYDKDKFTASSRKRSSGARHFYRLLI